MDVDVVAELQRMAVEVSRLLWAVHENEPAAVQLMLPTRRDRTTRVSEQESKILFCQVLERSGWFYSVETPTTEEYQQSGQRGLSARSDLSLYSLRDATTRAANIELKAHCAPDESFRKDFEKLLRERKPGLWFHTLVGVNATTLTTIFGKVRGAFSELRTHLGDQHQDLVFCFCSLRPRRLYLVQIALEGAADDRLEEINRIFAADADLLAPESDWEVYEPGLHGTVVPVRRQGDGDGGPRGSPAAPPVNLPRDPAVAARPRGGGVAHGTPDSAWVYSPELRPATFLHLSTKGTDHYFLRDFLVDRRDPSFKVPGIRTAAELFAGVQFAQRFPTSDEDRRHAVDKPENREYWRGRVRALNEAHIAVADNDDASGAED